MAHPLDKLASAPGAGRSFNLAANWYSAFVWLLLLLSPALITFPPLVAGDQLYLSTYTDDLFYYLKIAINIVDGNGSTFNQLVDTNGYQPLWQLLMVVLEGISRYAGINIFVLIALVLVGFGSWCLLELRLLLRGTESLVPVAVGYILYLSIALTGMEVAALVPLLLYWYRYIRTTNNLDWSWIGFVASLVVLVRLDAAVFVAVFLAVSLAMRFMTFSEILRFMAGGMLLPAYLLMNLLVFGSTMPVSGAAKSVLGLHLVIHGWTFRSLFNYGLATSLMNLGMIAAWLVAAVLLFSRRSDGSRPERVWLISCCLFVPLFYLQTALRSDWPIWRWYFYPLVLMSVSVFPLIATRLHSVSSPMLKKVTAGLGHAGIAALLIMVFSVYSASHLLQKNTRHTDAEIIQAFTAANSGIYAMGDRAGLPAFLSDQPFVQLEGLVMDKEYLRRLETLGSIEALLESYSVQYYLGSPREQINDACYWMKEPVYSEGYSRYVESSLCWPVVKTISRSGGGQFLVFQNPRMGAVNAIRN